MLSHTLVVVLLNVVLLSVHGGQVYVDIDSTASSPDGSGWSSAYSSITEAVSDYTDHGPMTMWITAGHYSINGSDPGICLTFDGISIYMFGGFSGSESSEDSRSYPLSETILDGFESCYHLLYLTRESTFDGIVFQRGYAMSDGDGTDVDQYGGVLSAWDAGSMTVVFKDCQFRNNTARNGGVFYGQKPTTSITFVGCTFEYNRALPGSYLGGYGGCIFASSEAYINMTNCQFRSILFCFVLCFPLLHFIFIFFVFIFFV